MLVKIKVDRLSLVFPLPLFLLGQTLDALSELVEFWELISPKASLPFPQHGCRGKGPGIKPSTIVKMCRSILNELCHYGRWCMAEVETKKPRLCRVKIDFF